MTRTFDTPPVSGRFLDRTHAQAAFDALMSQADGGDRHLDLVLYGSDGEYVLLVEARSPGLEKWVVRVLREHGAILQEQDWPGWFVKARNAAVRDVHGREPQATDEEGLLARWAMVGLRFADCGLLRAEDLLAMVFAAAEPTGPLSREERQRRIREADAELREVSARLSSRDWRL